MPKMGWRLGDNESDEEELTYIKGDFTNLPDLPSTENKENIFKCIDDHKVYSEYSYCLLP